MDKHFTILYQKYKEPIFAYVYYLSANRTLSEEICQDVFLKVYLHIGKFEGRSSFKTWLYQIAKNTYLDFMKKENRNAFAYQAGQLADTLVDKSHNPEEHLLNGETNQRIQLVLSKMSEKYRNFIILRDMQNLSYQEISAITETNLNSVKVNIYRARKKFREIYTELEGK